LKYELMGEATEIAEKVQTVANPGTVFVSQTTCDLIASRFGYNSLRFTKAGKPVQSMQCFMLEDSLPRVDEAEECNCS
jgi:class 3 adenylate cyclase